MRQSIAYAIAGLTAAVAAYTPSTKDGDASVWASIGRRSGPLPARRSISQHSSSVRRGTDAWNPPKDLVAPLDEFWEHAQQVHGDLYEMNNSGWDQIMATNGSISYCMRWDSNATLTKDDRDTIARVLPEQYNKWFGWVYGWDNFPFDKIDVKVIAYAVNDTAIIEGSTDGYDVYEAIHDGEGVPQCPDECARWHHRDNDYSGCKAGVEGHFDQTFWLTDGIGGGFGWDWGQRVGTEYFFDEAKKGTENITILLHEMGHTFALDDYYDWHPKNMDYFLMKAGTSPSITDFDGWMLRKWWYMLSRNKGWQTSNNTKENVVMEAMDESASTSAPAERTTVITVPVPGETQTPTQPVDNEPTNVNGAAPPLPTDNNDIFGPVDETPEEDVTTSPPEQTTEPAAVTTDEPTTMTTVHKVSTIQVTVTRPPTNDQPEATPNPDEPTTMTTIHSTIQVTVTRPPSEDKPSKTRHHEEPDSTDTPGDGDDDDGSPFPSGAYPGPSKTSDDQPSPMPTDIIDEILKHIQNGDEIDPDQLQEWLDELQKQWEQYQGGGGGGGFGGHRGGRGHGKNETEDGSGDGEGGEEYD